MKRQTGAIQASLFSKMSLDSSAPESPVPTLEEISLLFSRGYQNSGLLSRGGSLMPSFSVWLNEDAGSSSLQVSLSQVLENDVLAKYYLSPQAATGILRRAAKRGKTLPQRLMSALENLAKRPSLVAKDSSRTRSR